MKERARKCQRKGEEKTEEKENNGKERKEGGGKEWKLTRRKWWGKNRKMRQKRGKEQIYGREMAGDGRGRAGKGQSGKRVE